MTDGQIPGEPEDSAALPESPFYDPHSETKKHRHRLPHWQQPGKFCFITWRLADSLPQELLQSWLHERNVWLRKHPPPWDAAKKQYYRREFTERFDAWLDAGHGSCLLRQPALSKIVSNALHHFDGMRYSVGAFVIMPNHVHVLFALGASHDIRSIMQTWKGFTAHAINKQLERTGQLWQEDYWDRLLRSDIYLERCLNYIKSNPAKANLREGEYVHYEHPSIRSMLPDR